MRPSISEKSEMDWKLMRMEVLISMKSRYGNFKEYFTNMYTQCAVCAPAGYKQLGVRFAENAINHIQFKIEI